MSTLPATESWRSERLRLGLLFLVLPILAGSVLPFLALVIGRWVESGESALACFRYAHDFIWREHHQYLLALTFLPFLSGGLWASSRFLPSTSGSASGLFLAKGRATGAATLSAVDPIINCLGLMNGWGGSTAALNIFVIPFTGVVATLIGSALGGLIASAILKKRTARNPRA